MFQQTDSLFKMFKNADTLPALASLSLRKRSLRAWPVFSSSTCSLLCLAGWALKPDSHITFPDTFTTLVAVDFCFFSWAAETRENVEGEEGRDVDDITMNDMFSARSTWRLHTGTHECSHTAHPDDTDEPALCADRFYACVPVSGS